jgi:hypothetical protein
MQLAREWDNVLAGLSWAETDARELRRKAYSVDGAVTLLKVWRRAQNGGPDRNPQAAKTRSKAILRENAQLKLKLIARARYIAVLEEELAACAATSNEERQDLGAPDRSKVQKVAMLWLRPGTDGEGSAAAHKLCTLARRLSRPIGDLLHECGIEGPADWTFTPTE